NPFSEVPGIGNKFVVVGLNQRDELPHGLGIPGRSRVAGKAPPGGKHLWIDPIGARVMETAVVQSKEQEPGHLLDFGTNLLLKRRVSTKEVFPPMQSISKL